MSWRIEHGPDGRPMRAWWVSFCMTCRDSQTVYVLIDGARVPQSRPCPECSGARKEDGIRPKALVAHG